MQNDQRLTPLPVVTNDIQTNPIDFSSAYLPSYDDTLDSKRSIKQYINVVYKRLPIILAITILVTASVAFYSYRQLSEYEVVTGMIIEPRKPPETKKDAININIGGDPNYYNTQLQLLKDYGLMKRAVIALGLQRDANLCGNQGLGLLGSLRSLFTRGQKTDEVDNSLPIVSANDDGKSAEASLTSEENRRAEACAATFVSNLNVEQQARTNLVTLTLHSTNPGVAPRVSDKVAELFIDEDRYRETKGAETALQNLRKSIEELKVTIKQEEDGLVEAMKAGNLPLQEEGGKVRAADLTTILTQYRQAQVDDAKAEAEYSAAQKALQDGNILAVAEDNKAVQDERSQAIKRQQDLEKIIQDLDKKIDEKNQKREELLVKYQKEYKEVKAVDAEITELNKQKVRIENENKAKIQQSNEKIKQIAEREELGKRRANLVSAQQREAKLRAAFEQAAAKANIDGQAETNILGKQNELKSNRSLLDAYNLREKEQDLALATDAPKNIKLQSNAVTPTTPIGPQRGRNILVALFLSLGAGIGLAFLLDFLDDSVRTSDDITRHLGLPTLALIPHYLSSDKKKLLAATNGTSNGGVPASAALITMEERHSPMAEAYRHLRTSLLFSSAGKPPQTILVTSSQPSEGKTTTAINTAITLAQADADVVIIDCDRRRPRLHSHFGLENTSGLTNYLSGDKNTENLMRTYKDLPRLKIITSGPIPPNPAELLSSNEMRNLLTFLSGRFKHIIIDSPPAISFTDASILSTLVDGVVLVAMANKSSIHLMRQFKQRVTAIGARIYGVVLNGIKSNSEEYYYYGSGYYKYYSQADDDESTPLMENHPRAQRDTEV